MSFLSRLFFALAAVLPALYARPQSANEPEDVLVVSQRVYPVVNTVAPNLESVADTASLLRQLPGSNTNMNGAITGIAQYRGLYGDRVAVSLDGLGLVTGGPNAMDTPLSYASPLLLEELSLERGIASVSSAVESTGGHVRAGHDRGRYTEQARFSTSGKVQARYASNGRFGSTAMRIVTANRAQKFALLGQRDRADDLDYAGGHLRPTRLERDRYDVSYARRNSGSDLLLYAGMLDTSDTGTPALPMDIRTIQSNLRGIRFSMEPGAGASLDVAIGYSNVDHTMDNFTLRPAPASRMDYRSTNAQGYGLNWRVAGRVALGEGEWRIGIDGTLAEHTADITNPNETSFKITNFNSAERDIVGLYGQWNAQRGALDLEAGLRVNRVQTDADTVAVSMPAMTPMMEMMSANALLLAHDFNQNIRNRTRSNVDAVIKIGRVLGGMKSVYVELARKTRAPSYQELFLWLPMQSTGGLADGRSYVGNPALASETSREVNVGVNWQWKKAWAAPQIFYKDVSNYVQGVPSLSPTANAVAVMMTGMPALAFTNVDAEIFGMDLAWGYYFTDTLLIDGTINYARGRRIDVDDDLYRLAPLNGRVRLTYESEKWSTHFEFVAYAAQNKTAAFNGELRTAGYSIVNMAVKWSFGPHLIAYGSAENLLDKGYRNHLDGINRVRAVDVVVGDRLPGPGTSIAIGFEYAW